MGMKVTRLWLALALFLCVGTDAMAEKSERLKPKWVTHALPQSKSGTYIFVRAHGVGATLEAARQAALVDLTSHLEMERGIKVNSVLKSNMKETFTEKRSGHSYEEVNELSMVVEEQGKQLNIVCRVIDEYWVSNRKGYAVDILYTVADKQVYGGSYDDRITVTARYGAAGLMSVVPGLGQFYKGANAKGASILAGEVAAIGGIILCETTRASYQKMMIEQPKHAAEYNTLMNTWEDARNVCIGAAAAVYVVNLIDALATKGAKRVVVKHNKPTFALNPYMDAYGAGVGLALTF